MKIRCGDEVYKEKRHLGKTKDNKCTNTTKLNA